ncbi:DUF5605 domain-containing protein [Hominifimenecus sp. rT4P-3]|uniref:DUF5605 domain-containing protein n=1 Tax=Hominifimenecus sp. rT4P-3 TaxID=3242979 RepID=UPI003DA4CA75
MNYIPKSVEKWGVFEISCSGRTDGNPFTDYNIRGHFTNGAESVETDGFYDGDGIYKVRFMPSFEGEYQFSVTGTFSEEPIRGSFMVTPPSPDNHGPVRSANQFHFSYEDGSPYYPLGTTCYVWELQNDERIAETLDMLKESGFNKLRFCLFPKHYNYNLGEPRSYPYEGTPMNSSVLTEENWSDYTENAPGNHWDFTRFHPAHFQHIERCIAALGEIGVEADLIVMHPYDRWGFSCMTPEQDELYWKYVVARFAAYRNVWWSLANEYDLLRHKSLADWERYAKILCQKDPYHHLRSIHNCGPHYDHTRPWITHCSIQRQDLYKTAELTDEWRIRYQKPVVLDEIAYEGNLPFGWGNITGEEMIRRFWEAAMRGGYPGHGETYLTPERILWWSHGGKLKGESWKRIAFLSRILYQTPGIGLAPAKGNWDDVCAVPEDALRAAQTGYRIYYYSFMRPCFREFYFDDTAKYQVEVIDTWNMTIENQGVFQGKFQINLPGRQFMAIRLQKAAMEAS